MSLKAYIQKCERLQKKNKNKKLSKDNLIKAQVQVVEEKRDVNKLSMRNKQKNKKEIIIKIESKMKESKLKIKQYILRNLRRKYPKKIKYKKLRRSLKRNIRRVKNILEYPTKILKPLIVSRKISYVLSYFKLQKHTYKDLSIHNNMMTPQNSLKNKYSTSIRKVDTYKYNNNKCTFVTNALLLKRAKTYHNISHIKQKDMFDYTKGLLWKLICRFTRGLKTHKKKGRRIRFQVKILRKYSKSKLYEYYKYQAKYYHKKRYFNETQLKKFHKNKIKVKVNNQTIQVKLNMSKVLFKKNLRNKQLLETLLKMKYKHYKRRNLFRKLLHKLKSRLIGRNDKAIRKKHRKFFWLHKLYFYKQDLKNAYCSFFLYNPLLLQRLLDILNNKKTQII
jgi:hypothetical protein